MRYLGAELRYEVMKRWADEGWFREGGGIRSLLLVQVRLARPGKIGERMAMFGQQKSSYG